MRHKTHGDYVIWIAVIIIIIAVILCIIFRDKLNSAVSESQTVEQQESILDWFMEGQVEK